ncbi:MAG: succinate dehydrogenase, cytochrome b556 subunit [Gammaproteobacteria bacterium]|nr:succinate dehydrogenase, cytochrome b556 subunit [Gammaproteobacteria bacterium]
MNKQRFMNFDLTTIRLPFTSIISILHRLSGIFVFLLIPFLLYIFDMALSDSDGFASIGAILGNPISRISLWLFLVALGYHFFAGVRHLIMDMGFGEGLKNARTSGAVALVITLVWALWIGVWLW